METIAALEVGTSRVICLIGNRKEGNREELEILGLGIENCEVLSQGSLINMELAVTAIESAIKKAELMSGVEVEEIHLGISSRVCKGVQSEGMVAISEVNGEREVDINDIERVIEMAESVSLPPDQTIIHNIPSGFRVDDQVFEEPLGIIGVRLEVSVFLVYCPQHILDNLTRAVEKVGNGAYEIVDISLETLAATEAVLTGEEKKSNNIVIDLGTRYTSIIRYQDRSLAGLLTIDLGGVNITKDLAYALKTTFDEAERVKKEYGVALPELVDDEKIEVPMVTYNKFSEVSVRGIAQVVGARLEEIFTMIRDQIFMQNGKKDVSDNNLEAGLTGLASLSDLAEQGFGVVLVGGGALIEGCEEVAEKIFQVPCRVGDPLKITGVDKNIHRSDFATSVGIVKIAFDRMENQGEEEPTSYKSKGIKSDNKFKKYFKNFFT